jgi:TadE-like protein
VTFGEIEEEKVQILPSRSLPNPPAGASTGDTGAVAVEFALLLPLLMLFLFGIIQYGYGLFQLQTFNSTVSDSARSLATGITSCPAFNQTLDSVASGNGLDPAALSDIHVDWVNSDGSPLPQRLGYAKLTVSYAPFNIGLPFIPFPDEITRTRLVSIQDIGNSSLTGCLLP